MPEHCVFKFRIEVISKPDSEMSKLSVHLEVKRNEDEVVANFHSLRARSVLL